MRKQLFAFKVSTCENCEESRGGKMAVRKSVKPLIKLE